MYLFGTWAGFFHTGYEKYDDMGLHPAKGQSGQICIVFKQDKKIYMTRVSL